MTGSARPVLVAVDLDRTLIYSRNALGADHPGTGLRVVEMYDGAPLSHVSETGWALLTTLMSRAEFVPVTTRSTEQYQRVQFPRVPRHALCSNGGTLLVDDRPDPVWALETRVLAAESAPLPEVLALLEAVAGQPWVKLVRTVEDLFCYLVAHTREQIPAPWVAELSAAAEQAGWTVSVQGRKVYAVPAAISKGSGLARLRERIGPVVAVAAGDSLLDAPLLLAADHAIRPAHGELHDLGWDEPGVVVTAGAGVAAGEEILGWMLDHLDGADARPDCGPEVSPDVSPEDSPEVSPVRS